jgi:hypothetical protein
MSYRKDWGQPQQGGQGFARTRKTFGRTVTLGTADLVTANTVGAFMVPAGFVVTGIIAVATDMDSNGSPALTLSVGDSGSGTRYLSASTIGQGGTSTTTLASTGLLYKNTVDTEILVTTTLQPATAVAGTLDLRLEGYMDN